MDVSAHALIRQFYAFYNGRQIEQAGALFSVDAVVEHAPFGRPARGPEAYIASAERSFVAFPDAHIEVLNISDHGEDVYDIELVATGTHQGLLDLGEYGRFEATGLYVSVPHREVLEIHDGQITYASVTLDVTGLIAQLKRRAS
ncbi:MAG TPA: ester cyclase [Vicinamibacterales bacterium]|nr:ester cyclase [Vicinamibacterales bacterium]